MSDSEDNFDFEYEEDDEELSLTESTDFDKNELISAIVSINKFVDWTYADKNTITGKFELPIHMSKIFGIKKCIFSVSCDLTSGNCVVNTDTQKNLFVCRILENIFNFYTTEIVIYCLNNKVSQRKNIASKICCEYNVIDPIPSNKSEIFQIMEYKFVRDVSEQNIVSGCADIERFREDYDIAVIYNDCLQFALNNLTSFCVSCGKPHNSRVSVNFFLPCEKEICQLAYKELSFADKLLYIINKDINVAEIKLTIYYNYCLGKLSNLSINKLDNDLERLGFTSYIEIKDILETINIQELNRDNIIKMKNEICSLLIWILSSYELVQCGDDEYTYTTTNIAQLIKFSETITDECPEDFVTKTFHGSKPDVLHNILRGGLLNMSGTDRQTTGAAYGQGIYLGTKALASNYANTFTVDRPNSYVKLFGKRPLMTVALSCYHKFIVSNSQMFVVGNTPKFGTSPNLIITKLSFIH